MGVAMDTYSINPASIIDEAVDLSMRLAGSDFPISIFPTKIQRIISEVHECHNYPTDYIAAAILTAIAVGIGNTHLAQIKQGWVESPILYMALIGRPGANKSHPLSFAMKPFLDYDYQQNQVFEKALAKYDELMSMSRKERADNGEELQAGPTCIKPVIRIPDCRQSMRIMTEPRTARIRRSSAATTGITVMPIARSQISRWIICGLTRTRGRCRLQRNSRNSTARIRRITGTASF